MKVQSPFTILLYPPTWAVSFYFTNFVITPVYALPSEDLELGDFDEKKTCDFCLFWSESSHSI